MQRLAISTGKVDPRLTIEWPKGGRSIWEVFLSLGRPPSMQGACPISQQEIQAWQFNNQLRLTPWELEMIAVFDRVVIEASNKKEKA